MSHSVHVTYDRALVRRALNRFMIERMGMTMLLGLPGVSLLLLFALLSGRWDVWLSAISFVLAVAVVTIVFIYWLRLRSSEGFFAKTKNPSVTFIFSSEGVKTDSEIGSSELKWAVFDELLKFPDVWLLIYAKSGYLTLPTNVLTAECKAFIEQKMSEKR